VKKSYFHTHALETRIVKGRRLSLKVITWETVFGWGNVVPTMLRVKGNEVETSMGARVPVEHAVALLATVRKVNPEGRGYG
jgi:hypothetical protein